MPQMIQLDSRILWVVIALVIGIALGSVASSLSTNNQPWHALQNVSTLANGTASVDVGGDGLIDVANRALRADVADSVSPLPTFDCQIAEKGVSSTGSDVWIACPSGFDLMGGGGACSGGGFAGLVKSIPRQQCTTFGTPPVTICAAPEFVVNCASGSSTTARAICCRLIG